MTTAKTDKPKADKPAAKPAAKAAPKAQTKKAAKAAPNRDKAGAGEVKVTQMIGSIARRWDQEATLKGLGLNKRGRSRVLKDTPEVRGMIYKVRHLVKVEQA